jgi:hypothetical protein
VTDYTTIFVAGLSGLFGVAGGWLTGRQHRKTTEAQLDADRWKTDDQRHHEAIERRLENYREFLDVERELRVMAASSENFEQKTFEEWLARFNRTYNLLVLTGSGRARREAGGLLTEIRGMEDDRMADDSDDPFALKVRRAYSSHEKNLTKIRDDLIEQMRADIGSDEESADG